MKPTLTLIAALLLAPLAALAQERQAPSWTTSAVSVPRVEFRTFQSKAAKTAVSFHVFTPEIYDTEKERRFPVLYWLHGSGGGEKGIAPMAAFFARAIREGKIPPMLVVFPNGMAASMWCDAKDGTVPMETVLTQELVPHIDAVFRTHAKREACIVEGFSMGGYGAARVGFKHPQLFGAVSVLAGGPLDLDFAGPRAKGNPAERERILNGTFGGDLDYYRAVHPLTIAAQQADTVRGKTRVRVVIGAQDNTGPLNRAYSDHLKKLNIAHTFTIVPDVGHETLALLKGLGDGNWDFYRSAFAPLVALQAADTITNSIGMRLVRIEPGTFTMGQDGPPMEDYLRQKRFGEMHKDFDRIDFDEKPSHTVTITQPFLMGVTEVTVAQFRQFDPDFKKNDPKSKPADDDAASGVTWGKAVAFCEWLSKKEGKTYRLPTEAEWEFACRAGTTTLFHTGETLPDAHQKWFGEDNLRGVYFPPGPMPREYDWRNVGKAATKGLKQGQIIGLDHPEEESKAGGAGSFRVAQKTPNAWGLHDMHGNLAEWCSDWYGPYESDAQTDPVGRIDGDCRVFRGGFHSSMIRFLRSANRGSWVTNSASERIGFRVVQGELPKGKTLPLAKSPLNAQNVSQSVPNITPQPADAPFFEGPKTFVRIPEGAVGPVFISQNHSPSITECPNGDLLAVWFSTLGETDLTTSNAGARLRFGAKEWEPASPFWDAQDVNDHAPKIWWDGDKTLFHIVEGRQHGDILIRRSTDNGVTWSKAELMRAHGESASNPIRTKEGVIAIPFDFSGLSISRDNGTIWTETGRDRRGSDDIRPGGKGPFIAGIHSPIVELADGRLMAFGRLSPEEPAQKRFDLKMPVSYSSDLGETWQWEVSEFPVVSNTQRPAMLRLKEGPIVLCSFTDQARTSFKERHGLLFKSTGGDYKGTGLYAAVSYDEGKTWPDRRLIAKDGVIHADINGYLAITQTRDGRIQLLTSKDHYVFNLAWMKALPPAPKK